MLSLEGGHTHPAGRACRQKRHRQAPHCAAVGARHLEERIRCSSRTSPHTLWAEDGRCAGAVTETAAIPAGATVLATGGAAALRKRTTNPRGAIGSGMTLAYDAGAALADLEFMQFHPTAVAVAGELDGFLVTEAVRGDGALLVSDEGERFVDELAPRDEVTLAMQSLMSAGRRAFLDLRPVDMRGVPEHRRAAGRRRNRSRAGLVPVAPAAHYMIGGVVTDEHGRSTWAGSTRSGNARAPACTERTGSRRIRSRSASCSAGAQRWCAVEETGAPRAAHRPPPTRRAGRGRKLALPCGAMRAPYETRPASSAWRRTRTRSPG